MNTARILSFLALALMLISCGTEPNTRFYDVSVRSVSEGGGTVAPADSSSQAGSMINLQATANDGYEFSGWAGDVESSDNPLQLTVDQDYSLTANFINLDELFVLAENGETIRCPEAEPGQAGMVNGTEYVAVDRNLLDEKFFDGADLSTVCTSPVTDMASLFRGEEDFNQDISSWDVSNVMDMSRMFFDTPNFNGNISNWDTENITSMEAMFAGAEAFNQDLNNWDVSSVTNMKRLFGMDGVIGEIDTPEDGAISFNGKISDWNVSSVTDMSDMFRGAVNFNRDITNWDVSNVTSIDGMFSGAAKFSTNISNWEVRNVTDMDFMFSNTENFNQDLSGWCVQNISEKPRFFSEGSVLTEPHHPVWGTCPE